MPFRSAILLLLVVLLGVALVGCGGDDAGVATEPPLATSDATGVLATAPVSTEPTPTSAAPPATGPITSAASTDASTPITSQLALSHAPLLQETATLTYTFQTIFPVASATATVTLPSGATLVSGSLHWQGPLEPEEQQSLVATIRFAEEGNWTLEGKVLSPQENGDVWGDASYIYLYISATNSHPGFQDEGTGAVAPDGEEAPAGDEAPDGEEAVPTPPGVDPHEP